MSGHNRKPRKAIEMPDYYGQDFPNRRPAPDSLTAGVGLGKLGKGRIPLGNGGSIGAGTGKLSESVPSFNGWTIPNAGANGVDDQWQNILGRSSQGDFANWLASLGFSGKDPNDSWTQDFNAYLMQQMVEYYKQLEARQANKEILNEQRIYDSPTNQLARLMGAGISRDAAIQMLSGGSGSGSGLAYDAQVGGEGSLISPSESRLNKVNADLGIANTVINGVSAVSGLVNLGLSAPLAIRQAHFLKGQNFLQDSQISAYKSASSAFDILTSAGATADAFNNTASAVSAISKLAKDGNAQAAQFIANGGLQSMQSNAPFVSPVLANMYRSERSSSDYARMYTATMRKFDAENDLTELKYDALSQEILNSEALHEQIIANTDYLEAMEVTCKALGLNYKQSTSLLISQTKSQDLLNQATESLYNSQFDGRPYLDWRNDEVLSNLVSNARIAAKTTNPEYAESVYKQMFNTANSVAAAMSLQALKDQAGLEFSSKYPEQFKLWQGLQKAGAYDYLEYVIKSKTSANSGSPYYHTTHSVPGAFDVIDPDNYSPSWIQRLLNANHKE